MTPMIGNVIGCHFGGESLGFMHSYLGSGTVDPDVIDRSETDDEQEASE